MMLSEKYAAADLNAIKSYERNEGRAEGFAEGFAEGLSKGLTEGGQKMVYRLVSEKEITPEKGAKTLEISVEELKENMLLQGYSFPDSHELSVSSEDSLMYPEGFFSLFGSASDLDVEDDPEEH